MSAQGFDRLWSVTPLYNSIITPHGMKAIHLSVCCVCLPARELWFEYSLFSLSRTFYFIDIVCPTRRDYETTAEADIPTEYKLDELPAALTQDLTLPFRKKSSIEWWEVWEISSKVVYFYTFLTIEAANAATRQSLELYRVAEKSCELDQVLPPVQTSMIILIPTVFVTKIQFQSALREMRSSIVESIQKAVSEHADVVESSKRVAESVEYVYLEGEKKSEFTDEEWMTNKALLEVLRKKLVPRGFEVHGEEADLGFPYTSQKKISPFLLSQSLKLNSMHL